MSSFGSSSFGSSSFAGGIDADELRQIIETITLLGEGSGLAAVLFNAGFMVNGESSADLIHRIRDYVVANAVFSPTLESNATLAESLSFDDLLAVVWRITLTEGVSLADAAAGTPWVLVSIIDTLHAVGAVSARRDAKVALVTAIALDTLLAGGWKVEAVDTVEFQDAMADIVYRLGRVIEAAEFVGSATPSLRLTAIVAEGMDLGAAHANTLELFARASEDLLLYATFRHGDTEYSGWVLNGGAPSEYTNYPFNGFAAFAGKYYGTADDGLYELAGDTDAGDPIDVRLKTALMDFGTSVLKRAPDVYVSIANGNTLVLRVVTTGRNGVQREDVYTATVPAGSALHNSRVKVGAGLESTYWQWELQNVDGSAFELDELTFRPVVLSRRL